MKILFFIENLLSGGKERRLLELLKGLNSSADYSFELVLIRKEVHFVDVFELGFKIHFIERRYSKKDPTLLYKFYKIAKNFNPDIIHVWGSMTAFYAIPAKKILGIPMINNQIADINSKRRTGLLNKVTFTFSDFILANSRAGLLSYNVPVNKSTVIYNGFNFNRLENLADYDIMRSKFNIKTKFVVGMVAKFHPKKDFRSYILAAQIVLKQMEDVTFLCVGRGDTKPYKALISPEYLDRILFLGKQDDIESIVNICDIGVLATYTEGISNSIMEFMALKKPVIATDGGGTKELIENNKSGFLFKPEDKKALAAKILFLLKNREKAIEMGNIGKGIINNKFSIDQMISGFVEIYKKAAK